MLLSDVSRLSLAYIGPNSRTERPRKTKIGTEVADVTRDSDTTFKIKGQGHQVALVGCTGRPTWTYSNGDLSICVHLQAWAGAYHGGRPPTACSFYSQRKWSSVELLVLLCILYLLFCPSLYFCLVRFLHIKYVFDQNTPISSVECWGKSLFHF